MQLVSEINFKKRDWRRDLGVTVFMLGVAFVCADVWREIFLTLKWYHFLVAVVLAFPIHELAHGLLFKIWTGRVKFGAGIARFGPYLYASSPGSFLSRNKMLWVAVAPQFLTVPYFVLGSLPLVPAVQAVLILMGVLNLGGGGGDLYTIIQLLKHPKNVRVEDGKHTLKFYTLEEGGSSESAGLNT